MSKQTLKIEEVIKYINAALAGGYSPFIIEKRQSTSTSAQNVTYFTIFIVNEKKEKKHLIFEKSGEIQTIGSAESITTRGYEPQICFDKKTFPELYEICFHLEKLLEAELPKINKDLNSKKSCCEIIKTNYSNTCPDAKLKNTPYVDSEGNANPRFRISFDYETIKKEGEKRLPNSKKEYGPIRSELYRLDKLVKGKDGETTFDIEKASIEKIHEVFPYGTKIVDPVFNFSTASYSAQGLAVKRILKSAFVLPGTRNQGSTVTKEKKNELMAKYGGIVTSNNIQTKSKNNDDENLGSDDENLEGSSGDELSVPHTKEKKKQAAKMADATSLNGKSEVEEKDNEDDKTPSKSKINNAEKKKVTIAPVKTPAETKTSAKATAAAVNTSKLKKSDARKAIENLDDE